jgi:hypothetical protein
MKRKVLWRAKSGCEYDIANAESRPIELFDVAEHLAGQMRWNGGANQPYSVAEHSIRVAELLPVELKLSGLLHDGPEFILGDISAPLKSLLPEYQLLECEWSLAFARRFGTCMNSTVMEADRLVRIYEMHILFPCWEEHIPKRREAWNAFYERWDTKPGADMATTFRHAFDLFTLKARCGHG